MLDGWAPSAGGIPAMVGNVPLVMKDVVLLAVLVCPRSKDASR